MRFVLFILFFAVILMFIFSCSSEPCEDLENKAQSCLDNAVKSLLLKISKDGDKQECTDYLNSYYYTFESRCRSKTADAESLSDTLSD